MSNNGYVYRGPVGPFLALLATCALGIAAIVAVSVVAHSWCEDNKLRREIERAKAGLPAKESTDGK